MNITFLITQDIYQRVAGDYQHLAQPPSLQGYLTSAPGATVTAAVIVLLGVVFTLRSNNKRLRREQYEKRAKDKESRLQEKYAALASSAFQAHRYLVERQEATRLLGVMNEDVARSGNSTVEKATRDLEGAKADAFKGIRECRSSLASAYTALLLIDDRSERVASAHTIITLVDPWRSTNTDIADVNEQIIKFCDHIRGELEAQYREESALAATGRLPVVHRKKAAQPGGADRDQGGELEGVERELDRPDARRD